MKNLIDGFIATMLEDIHLTECEQDIECGYIITEADRATVAILIAELCEQLPPLKDTQENGSALYMGLLYDDLDTPLHGLGVSAYVETLCDQDYFYMLIIMDKSDNRYTLGEF